jgi:cell volume regulation protein A
MLPFRRWHTRDRLMLSWVGLKGAVPVIFAVMCKAEGVPNADIIFNVIFLCTIVSLLVQGATLTSMANKLNLATPPQEDKKLEHFDMDLPDEIQSTAREVEVTEQMLAKGNTPRELTIPPHTLIVLVRRGEDFFIPTGSSELQTGDQLLVISDHDANAAYRQLTDEAEEEAMWRAQVRAQFKARFDKAFSWMRKNHK